MVGALGKRNRVGFCADMQSTDCVLQLSVLDLLQQHPHLRLLSDASTFFLEHIKHLLDLVQEV